jgi:hypothetical protein
MAEFKETLHWVSRFEDMGASVLLFEYSPLPGSELYKSYKEGLVFDPESYSIYVVTGHEIVEAGEYRIREEHNETYRLIRNHPDIFPGFYRYANTAALQKQQRLDAYYTTRRTPVKSEYDL